MFSKVCTRESFYARKFVLVKFCAHERLCSRKIVQLLLAKVSTSDSLSYSLCVRKSVIAGV